MEMAVQLEIAAGVVTVFTPSNAASQAALETLLSVLGSIVTVIGVSFPVGAMAAAEEEAATWESTVIATADGLCGRRAPGGRSGIADLPGTHDPDDGGILSTPANKSGPVPPPDSNGNGGDEGETTPSIMQPQSVHHEDPGTDAGLIAILVG